MSLRTPFYDFHVSAGAKMVDFAGWEMPLLYKGIVQEHLHTRTKASLFDVSHMGRVRFSGPDATEFLDRVLTRNVSKQNVGDSRYTLLCNEAGGVLDDAIISRDEKDWLLVCNASNRLKLLEHFRQTIVARPMEVKIDDQTERTAMMAVQGPAGLGKMVYELPIDVTSMKRYTFQTTEVMFMKFTICRSGYTGEDGVEIILSAKAASMAMRIMAGKLTKSDATLQPAGLGARDTLRLEAGLPLYGHELSEQIDPISAGLSWAVDLNKDFVGAAALRKVEVRRKLVGLELEGRRIARQRTKISHEGQTVGEVTSGTFGPTLQRSIAMAYVDVSLAAEGTALSAEIPGGATPARVVKLPFYKRPITGK